MKKSATPSAPGFARLFVIVNIIIAITLISGAVILQKTSSSYQPQATLNRGYIDQTKAEKDPGTLQHGILHTEAARATAYRAVLYLSNGTVITWVLVSLALLMNAIFLLRLTRKHELQLSEAVRS